MTKQTETEVVEQLYEFLQGTVPAGYRIVPERVPKLTADQAWTVILYVQELRLQLSDEIDRCDVCGDIYDSRAEGTCLDYGDSPYHFCGACEYSDEYQDKVQEPCYRIFRHKDGNRQEFAWRDSYAAAVVVVEDQQSIDRLHPVERGVQYDIVEVNARGKPLRRITKTEEPTP